MNSSDQIEEPPKGICDGEFWKVFKNVDSPQLNHQRFLSQSKQSLKNVSQHRRVLFYRIFDIFTSFRIVRLWMKPVLHEGGIS